MLSPVKAAGFKVIKQVISFVLAELIIICKYRFFKIIITFLIGFIQYGLNHIYINKHNCIMLKSSAFHFFQKPVKIKPVNKFICKIKIKFRIESLFIYNQVMYISRKLKYKKAYKVFASC